MATFVTVTIDTEEEWDWDTGFPTRDLKVESIRNLPRFQALCARHGMAATYFTNQAVFDDPEARRTLLEVARQPRVEIGMHIHPWNTPPFDPNRPVATRETFVHNLAPEVLLPKLESVYQQFLKYGLRPTSFRGGRYSCGPQVRAFLRDRGFVADASVLPYTSWAEDGAPDYRDRDPFPVRLPPRHAGDGPFWEVPLTLGFTRRPFRFWRRAFALVERSWLRKLRLIGIAERVGLVRRVWLNLERPAGRNMLPFLRRLQRLRLPCVCLTLHSSSLLAGKNNCTPTRADEDRLFAYADEVFGALAGWPDFRPATVTEVALNLEELYHASTRN